MSQASNVVGASRASGPGRSTSPAASVPNRPLRQLGISRIDWASSRQRAPGHVHQILRLGPGGVNEPALRIARGDLGEHIADVSGDRLHQEPPARWLLVPVASMRPPSRRTRGTAWPETCQRNVARISSITYRLYATWNSKFAPLKSASTG